MRCARACSRARAALGRQARRSAFQPGAIIRPNISPKPLHSTPWNLNPKNSGPHHGRFAGCSGVWSPGTAPAGSAPTCHVFQLTSSSAACGGGASERRGDALRYSKGFHLQGQNLALTVSYLPYSLDSGSAPETLSAPADAAAVERIRHRPETHVQTLALA